MNLGAWNIFYLREEVIHYATCSKANDLGPSIQGVVRFVDVNARGGAEARVGNDEGPECTWKRGGMKKPWPVLLLGDLPPLLVLEVDTRVL